MTELLHTGLGFVAPWTASDEQPVNGAEPTRWIVREPVLALGFTLSNDA
jgi:hypothetical protein